MKQFWWLRSRKAEIEEARQLAEASETELEEVRSRWPLVNRISTEIEEQTEMNHFGELLTASMMRRRNA